MNNDGKADVVIAAGFGGGPRIAAFNGATIGANGGTRLFADFFAFSPDLSNGTYVAVGDINGDNFGDLIVGAGPGGGPRVTIFNGQLLTANGAAFDGAFSNFASLNCVTDLSPTGRGLAQLVRPAGRVLLVVFGTASIGELVVQLARRDPRAAFRRMSRHAVAAQLGGRSFEVRYHRRSDLVTAMAPWFRLVSTKGIGVFVPPSAAEPWISDRPALLKRLEIADRFLSGMLAPLGDHVLYDFERTNADAPA